MSASPSSTAPGTALHLAVEADTKLEIQRYLTFVAHKRGLRDQDAEDVVFESFRIGLQHCVEATGRQWDPSKEAATLYLGKIAVHVASNWYRRARRKPTSEMGEDEDFASAAPTAEHVMMEAQERGRVATEVRSQLAAMTRTGLSLRVLDAMRKGTRGHKNLADELECGIEDVRNAIRRITERARKLSGTTGKKG